MSALAYRPLAILSVCIYVFVCMFVRVYLFARLSFFLRVGRGVAHQVHSCSDLSLKRPNLIQNWSSSSLIDQIIIKFVNHVSKIELGPRLT